MNDGWDPAHPVSFGELVRLGAEKLRTYNVERAREESRLLLINAAEFSSAEFLSRERDIAPPAILSVFANCITKRANGIPVYRIIGEREFYGRKFRLSDATLEPRADTEIVIDTILGLYGEYPFSFLDIGTGTGCIAVSLLCERANASGSAVDNSQSALITALQNAKIHKVDDRLETIHSDLLQKVSGTFDLIVSNPPYIPTQEISRLEREVRDHDPISALDGGEDGFDLYRKILDQARGFLKPSGYLILEMGHGQSEPIQKLADKHDWKVVSVHHDLAGTERVICLN